MIEEAKVMEIGIDKIDDDRNDRNLRYSIRDIPTFHGKGDVMPHTHLIEFQDLLDQKKMNCLNMVNLKK